MSIFGPREFLLMGRAYRAASYGVNVPHLMTSGDKERAAAARLEARGFLRRYFPGAGPGHPLRKYFSITLAGMDACRKEWSL